MVYKHRTKSGKMINFQNKQSYEKWKKGYFANKMQHKTSKTINPQKIKSTQKTTGKKVSGKVFISKDEYKESFGKKPVRNRFRDTNITSKHLLRGEDLEVTTDLPKEAVLKKIHAKVDWYGIDNDLGKTWNTESYHRKNGGYYEYRENLHERIINNMLKETSSSKKPVAILMGGGGASGKGYVLENRILTNLRFEAAVIDPDVIKSKLPEKRFFQKDDPLLMSSRLHNESSKVAKQAIDTAIKQRKSFIFDGTMRDEKKYSEIVDKLKKNGYNVKAAIVYVDFDEAVRRSQRRGKETGRFVPLEVLRDSHSKVAKTFDKLRPKFDSWVIYDNSSRKLKIVAEKGMQKKITDPKIFETYSPIRKKGK